MRLANPLGIALVRRTGRRDTDFDKLGPLVRGELPAIAHEFRLDLPMPVLLDLTERASIGLGRRINEPKYVASFSLTPRDPTMWGHYGGAERGFCLIFRLADGKLKIQSPYKAFNDLRPTETPGLHEWGIYADAEVQMLPVTYRSAPLRFNAFHRLIPHFVYSEEEDHYDVPLLLPGGAPRRREDAFGLVKATTWKYEQEVRAFLPAFGKIVPEARCLQYSWSQLAGVVFGPKISNEDRERLIVASYLLQQGRGQIQPRTSPFVFLAAQQRSDSFQMAVEAVGVLDGFYAPELLPIKTIDPTNRSAAASVEEILSAVQR